MVHPEKESVLFKGPMGEINMISDDEINHHSSRRNSMLLAKHLQKALCQNEGDLMDFPIFAERNRTLRIIRNAIHAQGSDLEGIMVLLFAEMNLVSRFFEAVSVRIVPLPLL